MMQIFCDNQILVVNKSCGHAVQNPAEGGESLLSELQTQHGRLWVVHRLDMPVSGLVVFARTAAAAAELSNQFRMHSVEKRYIAAVDNEPPGQEGVLENYIYIPRGKKINKVFIKERTDKNVKKAVLAYRLIYRTERYRILEIILKTGRKHQIRAQLAAIGCHIKGDVKYGAKRTNQGGGIHLHAYFLKIRHPGTGEEMIFKAPPPEDPLWTAVTESGALPTGSE